MKWLLSRLAGQISCRIHFSLAVEFSGKHSKNQTKNNCVTIPLISHLRKSLISVGILCLLLLCPSIPCSNSSSLKRHFDEGDSSSNHKRQILNITTDCLRNFASSDPNIFSSCNKLPSPPETSEFLSQNDVCCDDSFQEAIFIPEQQTQGNYDWQLGNITNDQPFSEEMPTNSVAINKTLPEWNHFQFSNQPEGNTQSFSYCQSEEDLFNDLFPKSQLNFQTSQEEIDNLGTELKAIESANQNNRELSSIEKSTSDTLANQQQNSNVSFSFKSKHDVYHFPFGAVSSKDENLLSYSFRLKLDLFCYFFFSFGTNNLESLCIVQYSVKAMRYFLELTDSKQSINESQFIVKGIQAIFQTVPTSRIHRRPYYYVCSYNNHFNHNMKYWTKIPFYFLFTSISYLIQNSTTVEQFDCWVELKTTIKKVYLQKIGKRYFSTKKWKFLNDKLVELKIIDQREDVKLEGKKDLQFDLSTLSFIYTEMKENKITQQFFTQVWNACKKEYHGLKFTIQVLSSPKLNIHHSNKYITINFQSSACKLYQIEFKNFLFKRKWDSISQLLKKYTELRQDFESLAVDFRMAIFSRKDFNLLKEALKVILIKFNEESVNDMSSFRDFIIELEYFAHTKCFLFFYDLFNEFKETEAKNYQSKFTTRVITDYQNTLKSISEIDKLLEIIDQVLSLPRIHLNSIPEEIHGKFPTFLSISLHSTCDGMKSLLSSAYESTENIPTLLPQFSYFIEYFVYLKICFSKLPNNLTRYEVANFIAELDNILEESGNKEEEGMKIENIFSNLNYDKFTKLLIYNPRKDNSADEIKKEYLKHLREFFILHNQ